MDKKVLVAGATGYLGRYVVRELKERGYHLRVLIRREEQKELFAGLAVDEFFTAQVTNAESLEGIAAGMDWVFSSIGITRQKDGMSYMDVDYQGNMNLLKEAEKAGVDLFQYVSVFGAKKAPQLKIIQAKEKFVAALKDSPIKSSVIRPTGFFSDMREVLLMAKKGKVYLIGSGENKLNPISGRDLAKVCVDAMEQGADEVNVGGPKIYTQNQIARIAFDALGINGKVLHMPLWLRDILLVLLRTLTPSKFYGPFEFFLTAMTLDAVTDRYGEDLLEDFYKQEAENL